MPCLALKGVAEAIARSPSLYAKVLLCTFSFRFHISFLKSHYHPTPSITVNTENDRETGGYKATDYIAAITRTLNSPPPSSSSSGGVRRSHYHYQGLGGGMGTTYPVSAFITHLVYLSSGSVLVDERSVMVRVFLFFVP
jgi:hypothetical protein